MKKYIDFYKGTVGIRYFYDMTLTLSSNSQLKFSTFKINNLTIKINCIFVLKVQLRKWILITHKSDKSTVKFLLGKIGLST